MRLTDEWFSALSEGEGHQLIIVTGRDDIDEFIQSGKFKERVEIRWKYAPDDLGMPQTSDAQRMEEMEEALRKVVEKNKLAILTEVATGAGEKSWVFYTRTSAAFFENLNSALAPFETFPLEFALDNDPNWEEYRDMYEMKKEDEESEE